MHRRWAPNRMTSATEASGTLQSSFELGERLPRFDSREPLGRGAWLFYAGTYANTIKYFAQDIVKSGSSFYVCLLKNGPGTTAGVKAVTDTTYWLPFGGGGGGGGNMTFRGDFDSTGTTYYVVGDVVIIRSGPTQGLYWCYQDDPTPGSPFGTPTTDPATGARWVMLTPGYTLGTYI